MAQPVWVLSVDLQTKTATFQSGMADAAKSARSAFTEIKSGSTEMGTSIGGNMFASRHAIMAVSEAFGVQVPRAITALLAHIGPLGAALEAAFPFAAIALGAVLLIEKLAEMKEEGIKLTEDQVRFGTTVQTVFNGLEQKLLGAAIKTDELRNDHLAALHHQLQLIDMQSMEELVHSFATVAKEADVVFADLKSHWYTFGIGSDGAKHALDEFQTKYDSLLASGKDGEASSLLSGTLRDAQLVLAAQESSKAARAAMEGKSGTDPDAQTAMDKARIVLKAAGVGWTEKEVKAQEALVGALNAQVEIESKVSALKKADSGNASAQTGKELAALAAEGARSAAEHKGKMGEISLAAEKEQAQAGLAIQEATVTQRLLVDMAFADKERNLQLQTNAGLQAALDRGGKDYNNQLAGLREKAQEIEAQHAATISELISKAGVAQNAKSLQDLEQSERERIEATQQGTAGRLAAIDAALKEEQAKGLQSTTYYRELLQQRVQAEREATAEAGKLAAEAGREGAQDALKTGQLRIAAEEQSWALLASGRRISLDQQTAQEQLAAKQEYALKMAALQQEEAALDKAAKDYQNKLQAIHNQEKQLTQAHENEVTAIEAKAAMERNQKVLSAAQHFNDEIVAGLTQVLMGHKTFASMMNSLGSEVASGMMQNAIKTIEANLMGKESDAAKAARTAYNLGLSYGGPAGVVLGPVLAAAAFSQVMAFNDGGVVPGIGYRDNVPAMVTPGEGIIPNSMMDNLNQAARSGGLGGKAAVVHFAPVYHLTAIDSQGMEKVLVKHNDVLKKHVENEVRKLNG